MLWCMQLWELVLWISTHTQCQARSEKVSKERGVALASSCLLSPWGRAKNMKISCNNSMASSKCSHGPSQLRSKYSRNWDKEATGTDTETLKQVSHTVAGMSLVGQEVWGEPKRPHVNQHFPAILLRNRTGWPGHILVSKCTVMTTSCTA